MKLNNLKVIDVEIENVDMKDYPTFVMLILVKQSLLMVNL